MVWRRRTRKALAEQPLVSIEKIGEAAPKPWPAGDRPLAGLRVLDLSRVIAGPVAGRTLAAHGADVMLISGPDLPAIPWLTIDTGRGKLTSFVDLKNEQGRATLRDLLAQADIFSQGYRPRAIAALGFSPEDAAQINPGIVYVSLSAYGHEGPWAERRGFNSLVQTSTGFNHAEGEAAGVDGPKELPAQMLDHATGYLMAFGAMMAQGAPSARRRQLACPGVAGADRLLAVESRPAWPTVSRPRITTTARLRALWRICPRASVRCARSVMPRCCRKHQRSGTGPAMPLGSHQPQWPARQ